MAPRTLTSGTLLRWLVEHDHPLAYNVDRLAQRAGSLDALLDLDDAPLPPWRYDPPSSSLHAKLALDALALIDAPPGAIRFDALLPDHWERKPRYSTEIVTVTHRLLALVIEHDPSALRTIKDAGRLAAALVWAALRGNMHLRPSGGGRWRSSSAAEVWSWFDTTDASKLGLRLASAAGCPGLSDDDWDGPRSRVLLLGRADLLDSRHRTSLIEQRDEWARIAGDHIDKEEARRPVRYTDDGKVWLRAALLPPFFAMKCAPDEGPLRVVVGFGNGDDDAELFALSVPDAHRLVQVVQGALGDPTPLRGGSSRAHR